MSPVMNRSRVLCVLVGRIDHQVTPQPRMPAPRTGPILPTFRPPGGELYERSEAPSPKGGSDSSITAASYSEESPIVREAIPPSLTPDEQNPKKSRSTVKYKREQKLGATTSKMLPWQIYRE